MAEWFGMIKKDTQLTDDTQDNFMADHISVPMHLT